MARPSWVFDPWGSYSTTTGCRLAGRLPLYISTCSSSQTFSHLAKLDTFAAFCFCVKTRRILQYIAWLSSPTHKRRRLWSQRHRSLPSVDINSLAPAPHIYYTKLNSGISARCLLCLSAAAAFLWSASDGLPAVVARVLPLGLVAVRVSCPPARLPRPVEVPRTHRVYKHLPVIAIDLYSLRPDLVTAGVVAERAKAIPAYL